MAWLLHVILLTIWARCSRPSVSQCVNCKPWRASFKIIIVIIINISIIMIITITTNEHSFLFPFSPSKFQCHQPSFGFSLQGHREPPSAVPAQSCWWGRLACPDCRSDGDLPSWVTGPPCLADCQCDSELHSIMGALRYRECKAV